MDVLVATNNGIRGLTHSPAGWQQGWSALEGKHITSAVGRGGVILAGTRQGILRSQDSGASWQPAEQGLTIQHVRWLAFDPSTPDLEFAGTEPAGIFVSRNGGDHWQGSPEVEKLRDEFGWFLPYSPAAGCIRGFTFSDERTYAAAEVGGLLVSEDQGRSWSLVDGSPRRPAFGSPPDGAIHPDVHSIESHPADRRLLFAPTGGGLYRSMDSGKSWVQVHSDYCRALWIDPDHSDHLLLGPARDASGRRGRIEESRDGGLNWNAAATGTGAPWQGKMIERFAQVGEHLFAVLSNGELLVSRLDPWSWAPAMEGLKGVNSLAAVVP